MSAWPEYGHDGLGGPQHTPMVVEAVIDTACKAQDCGHEMFACPTAEAVVCSRCTDAALGDSDLAFSQAWPCPYADEEAS